MQSSGENELSKEDLQKFVDDNFLPPGSEFVDWEPSDWKDEVELFSNIKVTHLMVQLFRKRLSTY